MLTLPHTSIIENTRIAWGTIGHGPPLVAIHGTPFSSQVWRQIVPYVAHHRTIYFHDLAGYGMSEMRDGQDVSLGIQNAILAGLFAQWGLDRPDVLAHDFGGATALRAHYLNSLRYASLTLVDAVALAPWGSPFVQHVRHHEQAFAEMPPSMHKALLEAYLRSAAHSRLSDEALAIYAAPWIGPVGQRAFYRQIAQMDQAYTDAIEPLYARMECPVRVLWGRDDQWLAHTQGETLAGLLSQIPCQIIPDAGHLMQEDCPQAIVAALLAQFAARQ